MATILPVAAVPERPVRPPGGLVRWKPARKALVITIALRIYYSILAAIFSPHLTLNENLIRSNRLTDHLMNRELHPVLYSLLGVWERFDTLWYIEISRRGYVKPMATVFYPLYPALIRAFSVVLRSELAAAVFISSLATFFLVWGALRLFETDAAAVVAFRAVLLWSLWPAGFIFFAGYPDSHVCALTVWAIGLARSERWSAAGMYGFLAGLTKAIGFLTALPLLWIAWKKRDRKGALAALLCCAGVGGFQGWLMLRHYPTASETYRLFWGTETSAPWTTALDVTKALAHGPDVLLIFNAAVLAVVMSAALSPRVRFEYKLYAAAAMCLFLTKHTDPLLQSTMRYSLAVFPAYPALAGRLERGGVFLVVLLTAAGVGAILFHAFLDWGLVV